MKKLLWLPGPMEGVMSPEWVQAANHLCLTDKWITPFFRLSRDLPRKKHFTAFLKPYQGVSTVMQLMGTDPGLLAEAAVVAEEAGADGVDLNFGCPSSQVLRHGAGGALLKTPALAGVILRRTGGAVRIPVSAKIRCGWESAAELPCLLDHLLAAEPSMLTLHFRCVREGYLPLPPEAREKRFRLAADTIAGRCPLILNGDFETAGEMHGFAERFSAAGAMAARGLLRDPGLLRRAAGLPTPEAAEMREAFFRAVIREYPGGMPPGRAMELSIFIWGKANPYFTFLRGRREPVFTAELPPCPADLLLP